jgi:hypothetical protein
MVAIRQRGEKFETQIRHVGLLSITRSFSRYADAVAWSRKMEADSWTAPLW